MSGLGNVRVRTGDPLNLKVQITLGLSKQLPAIKWYVIVLHIAARENINSWFFIVIYQV